MTVPAGIQGLASTSNGGASRVVPYRLTARQFEKMIAAGVFRDLDHVELLSGLLVDKMTKNDPHDFAVAMLAEILRRMALPGCFVREEKSIVLDKWTRLEPDLGVFRGQMTDFRARGPRARDVLFLVEIADSSYVKDRGPKWQKYAASGIPEYWLLNCPLRRLEIFTQPTGKGRKAAYESSIHYEQNDAVPVVLSGQEVGRLKLSDVLA